MSDAVYESSVIDIKAVEAWLTSHVDKLGDFKIAHGKKSGVKFLINSPWMPDTKRHTAIMPERGKYGRYVDHKSGNKGSVVDFVMYVDGVDFKTAISEIASGSAQYQAHTPRVDKVPEQRVIPKGERRWSLKLPDNCVRILPEHAQDDGRLGNAYRYVSKRMIDPLVTEAYCCLEDYMTPSGKIQRLTGRVLLPFRDWNGELWYWTARALSPFIKPRYLEPTGDDGTAPKEEILYCPSWDIHGRNVLVTEGPIDAISVWMCGMYSVSTQGSTWYMAQQKTLKEFKITPVFAFDRDPAGCKALFGAIKAWGDVCFYVMAPDGHDWNSALVAMGKDGLKQHILDKVALVDEMTIDMLAWKFDREETRRNQKWTGSTNRTQARI